MATQDEKIKWVEGSPFMVDGFRFTNARCKHYLLTHFHSDHTTGLYKSFSAGTIYTSRGTANLVTELMGVNSERVVALPMNTPVIVAGFELTLIDANHCPAAVMFLIRDPRPGGRVTLHTGDFRANKSVCTSPVVRSFKGRIDSLYLDTTYCGPRHAFPDQEEVLAQAERLVRMELQRNPKTLFLVGTYSIGKEKVLAAVAKAAQSRCLVTSRKARMMRLSGAWDDSAYTTHDATTGGGVDGMVFARVRAVPLQDTNSPTTLLSVLAQAKAAGAPFTSVVGVRPTGWTHTNPRKGGTGKGNGAAGPAVTKAWQQPSQEESSAAGSTTTVRETVNGPKEKDEQDGFADGADMAGETESMVGEDQDDEAAAWGAGDGDDGQDDGSGRAVDGVGISHPPGSTTATPPQENVPWSGKKPWVEGDARVYSLPYSEHSSYTQLKDFVRAVRPKAIVPTVNAASGSSVEKMMRHFLEYMDLSKDRTRLDSYFCKPTAAVNEDIGSQRRGRHRDGAGDDSRGGNDSARFSPQPSAVRTPGKRPRSEGRSGSLGRSFPSSGTGGSSKTKAKGAGQVEALQTRSFLSSPPPPLTERLNARIVTNPYVAKAGGAKPGQTATPSPVATPSPWPSTHDPAASHRSPAPGTSPSPPGSAGDAAVELSLVDIEAQRAIMADIERRKREQLQQQGLGKTDATRAEDLTCGKDKEGERGNRISGLKSSKPLRKASGGSGSGNGNGVNRGHRAGGIASGTRGGCAVPNRAITGGVVHIDGPCDAAAAATGAGAIDQFALAVKSKTPSSPANTTMNIREFFPRRN